MACLVSGVGSSSGSGSPSPSISAVFDGVVLGGGAPMDSVGGAVVGAAAVTVTVAAGAADC